MKKETKGKQVKRFTAHVPPDQLGEPKEKLVVPIFFRAADSTFAAYVPDHIAHGVADHPEAPKSWRRRDQAIVSLLADDIEPGFEALIKLYEQIQRNAAKRKVIQVHVKANYRGGKYSAVGKSGVRLSELSFAPSPALSIWHRILWQVGNGLYSAHEDKSGAGRLTHLSYICAAPKPEAPVQPGHIPPERETFVIDWTPEREAFFDNMREGLLTLIERIAFMLGGDTSGNVDRLIAGGGLIALPAPSSEGDS